MRLDWVRFYFPIVSLSGRLLVERIKVRVWLTTSLNGNAEIKSYHISIVTLISSQQVTVSALSPSILS